MAAEKRFKKFLNTLLTEMSIDAITQNKKHLLSGNLDIFLGMYQFHLKARPAPVQYNHADRSIFCQTDKKKERIMGRKRLTQFFPGLLPLRKNRRKLKFLICRMMQKSLHEKNRVS